MRSNERVQFNIWKRFEPSMRWIERGREGGGTMKERSRVQGYEGVSGHSPSLPLNRLLFRILFRYGQEWTTEGIKLIQERGSEDRRPIDEVNLLRNWKRNAMEWDTRVKLKAEPFNPMVVLPLSSIYYIEPIGYPHNQTWNWWNEKGKETQRMSGQRKRGV